jgi:hypothetical protein
MYYIFEKNTVEDYGQVANYCNGSIGVAKKRSNASYYVPNDTLNLYGNCVIYITYPIIPLNISILTSTCAIVRPTHIRNMDNGFIKRQYKEL